LSDDNGLITLTDQVGSFPVTSGQTLVGDHSTTGTNPTVSFSGTSVFGYSIVLNSVNIGSGAQTAPISLPVSAGSALSPSDFLVVTITNP
jgi:hypothetical protein